MKKIIFFVGIIILSCDFVFSQEDGAVRINFGTENVPIAPVIMSGDDPNIPPKPKRTFTTNSVILNQILQACDAGWDDMNSLLERLQTSEKLSMSEEKCADCFMIVYKKIDKEIISVFDKGNGKRMELLHNQWTTDDLFKGEEYGRILFFINE